MKTLWLIPFSTAGTLLLVACGTHSILEQRTGAPRANYTNQIISPEPPSAGIVNSDPTGSQYGIYIESQNQGTWTFTTPPTHRIPEPRHLDLYHPPHRHARRA
jgi:hypothetical protein